MYVMYVMYVQCVATFLLYIQVFNVLLAINTGGIPRQVKSNHSNIQLHIEPTKPNLTSLDTSIGFLPSISPTGASKLHKLKSHVSLYVHSQAQH